MGIVTQPGRLRKNAGMAIAGGVAQPLAQAATAAVGVALSLGGHVGLGVVLLAAVGVGVLVQGWSLARAYRLCGAPAGGIVFFPLGCWIVARVMLEGASDLAHRRPISWAGKQYVLEARS